MERFSFGEPVLKVEQEDKQPKKVFILGVYASAVHAKWISEDGKTLINALAVASEPQIFWRGEDANIIVSKIKLPKGAGKLIPADYKYNGPSGRTLDEQYLTPLGLQRSDCWLSDLVPFSMLNPGQGKALKRNEELFNTFKLKKYTIKSATKENRKIDDSRMEEIADEIKKSKAKYLITLGNEPLVNFVKEYNPDIKPLDLKEQYGLVKDIRIDGFPIRLIPLVHPRQAGKLNHYSKEWNKKHNDWISTDAEKLKREIAKL